MEKISWTNHVRNEEVLLRLSTHEAINATFDRVLGNASCVPGAVVRKTSSHALVRTLSEIARLHMYAALPFLYFTNARQQLRVS
jgi:hypothetical protein